MKPTLEPDKPSNLLISILQQRCPHCRKGKMFKSTNPYKLKSTLAMHKNCPECNIKFEPELGFYVGTGYVSYALSIAISVATFLFTLVIIGFSVRDNSLFYWMGINIFILLLMQPVLMRLSRVIWLAFFTKKKKASV